MSYIIKKATLSDIENLSQLYEEFDRFNISHKEKSTVLYSKDEYEKYAKEEITENIKHIFLAYDIKIPIGYLVFYVIKQSKTLFLEDIFISEKYRGRGIGKMFMQIYETFGKENNLKLEITAYKWNKTACKIYKNLGYKENKNIVFFEKETTK